MTDGLTMQQRWMAMELAARHRIPKATVTHPQGVIVPGNALLTENIKDVDYVPYCGPCMPCQRIRRVKDGFICPTCGFKSNWDLTPFDGNVNVKFAEGFKAPVITPVEISSVAYS